MWKQDGIAIPQCLLRRWQLHYERKKGPTRDTAMRDSYLVRTLQQHDERLQLPAKLSNRHSQCR